MRKNKALTQTLLTLTISRNNIDRLVFYNKQHKWVNLRPYARGKYWLWQLRTTHDSSYDAIEYQTSAFTKCFRRIRVNVNSSDQPLYAVEHGIIHK